MKHWQQLNSEDRMSALEITSARKKLPMMAVEKDWWVTMALKALSSSRYSALMSFKGGTSLSKGWGLISRFSEDIDIALKREDIFSISSTTGNQLTKLRRSARHYIIHELPLEISDILKKMNVRDFTVEPEVERIDTAGNKIELRAVTHPSTIFINYKSILPDISNYIQPRVKIEISCLSMDEPVETKVMRSMLSEILKDDEDVEVAFQTVLPSRTFLEKIFLLHEEFQKAAPRTTRMSRHLYDIEKIMDTPYGSSINDKALYDSIVNHRSIFNRIDGVDYALHAPEFLSCLPPKELLTDWEKDYLSMQRDFIFEADSLPFDRLLDRIRLLIDRIRSRSTK